MSKKRVYLYMNEDNLSDDCFEEKLIHEKFQDPDKNIKFKEINLRITKEQFEEWKGWAKGHNKSLEQYIKSSVESQAMRELIIDYLDERARTKPWWEKRPHNL